MGLDIADHETAAVVVDQGRQLAVGGVERRVVAKTDLAARPGEGAIVDLAHRQGLGLAVLRHLVDSFAAHCIGQRLELGPSVLRGLLHQVEQHAGFGVEHFIPPDLVGQVAGE